MSANSTRRCEEVLVESDLPLELAQAAESQGATPHPPRLIAFLAEAGVEIQAVRALGIVHSFWRQPKVFDASRATLRDNAGRFDVVKAKRRSLAY